MSRKSIRHHKSRKRAVILYDCLYEDCDGFIRVRYGEADTYVCNKCKKEAHLNNAHIYEHWELED